MVVYLNFPFFTATQTRKAWQQCFDLYALEVRSTGAEAGAVLPTPGSCRKLKGRLMGVRSGRDTGGQNLGRFTLRSMGASCSGGESATRFLDASGGEGDGEDGERVPWSREDWAGRDWGEAGLDRTSLLDAGGGSDEAGDERLGDV